MTIQTDPVGADVSAVSDDGNESKLGQTPLEMTPEMMDKFSNNIWHLSFNKMGYVKDQVFINTATFRKVGHINLKLTPDSNWAEAYQDKDAYKYLNDVSSMSAEIQGATIRGDYPKAESIAHSLITRYPKLSVGWNLLGNIYYLQKRMDKAIESYQKSLEINPDNQATRNILEKIRGERVQ